MAVGFAPLHLSAAAPPTNTQSALRIAAEHFAFCPDTTGQGAHPPHPRCLCGTPRRHEQLGLPVGLTPGAKAVMRRRRRRGGCRRWCSGRASRWHLRRGG
ncbi:DUF4253 domain-containing protein [Streptomyces tendae]|uniref:DUF4253 domain-containing protein n=1 Tax=Streptomyces tendae TaxID=1932 RepID=UPI00384DFB37